MIKRDTIQRFLLTVEEDGQGGVIEKYEPKENITVHLSFGTSYKDILQYGIKDEPVVYAVSDFKLDDSQKARYEIGGKYFQVRRQVKQGNEYFITLMVMNK